MTSRRERDAMVPRPKYFKEFVDEIDRESMQKLFDAGARASTGMGNYLNKAMGRDATLAEGAVFMGLLIPTITSAFYHLTAKTAGEDVSKAWFEELIRTMVGQLNVIAPVDVKALVVFDKKKGG